MSIEAMKMESQLHAPRAGRVAKVWVKVGATVDAKDLVVELDLSAN
jgi:pyruvate carboxylase